MYLYAISFPGNIEARIEERKRALFRATGRVSLHAFPSVIPILLREQPPEIKTLARMRRHELLRSEITAGAAETPVITTLGVEYFPLHMVAWEELVSAVAAETGKDSSLEYRTFPDIFNVLRTFGLESGRPVSDLGFNHPAVFMGYCGDEWPEDKRDGGESEPGEKFDRETVLAIRWKHGELICLEMRPEGERWWEGVSFTQL